MKKEQINDSGKLQRMLTKNNGIIADLQGKIEEFKNVITWWKAETAMWKQKWEENNGTIADLKDQLDKVQAINLEFNRGQVKSFMKRHKAESESKLLSDIITKKDVQISGLTQMLAAQVDITVINKRMQSLDKEFMESIIHTQDKDS